MLKIESILRSTAVTVDGTGARGTVRKVFIYEIFDSYAMSAGVKTSLDYCIHSIHLYVYTLPAPAPDYLKNASICGQQEISAGSEESTPHDKQGCFLSRAAPR